MQTDVLIVSYESKEHTLRLLRDLSALRRRVRVSVFDNASRDGTPGAIRRAFPWAQVFESDANLGYAGALRAALPRLPGELLWLLNADLRLPAPQVLARLEGELRRDPSAGAVGPAIVDPCGRRGPGGGGAALSARSAALHFSGLSKLPPWRRAGLYLSQAHFTRSPTLPVDWIAGTAPLIRRDALERAGGVPDSPFLYGEDLLLCRALRRAGYRLLYAPAAQVVHIGQGSQSEPSGRWVEGTLRAAAPRERRAIALCLALGLGGRLALSRLRRVSARERASLETSFQAACEGLA